MKTAIIILLMAIFAVLMAILAVLFIKFIEKKTDEAYKKGYDYAVDVSSSMAQNEAKKQLAQMLQSYSIKEVIYAENDVFVVKWNDGKSTYVKRKVGDVDNPFKAFCYCLLKQMYGDRWKIMFKKYNIVDTQDTNFYDETCYPYLDAEKVEKTK